MAEKPSRTELNRSTGAENQYGRCHASIRGTFGSGGWWVALPRAPLAHHQQSQRTVVEPGSPAPILPFRHFRVHFVVLIQISFRTAGQQAPVSASTHVVEKSEGIAHVEYPAPKAQTLDDTNPRDGGNEKPDYSAQGVGGPGRARSYSRLLERGGCDRIHFAQYIRANRKSAKHPLNYVRPIPARAFIGPSWVAPTRGGEE